ncbi:unnamed protein product, partial [Polarella glacialis]
MASVLFDASSLLPGLGDVEELFSSHAHLVLLVCLFFAPLGCFREDFGKEFVYNLTFVLLQVPCGTWYATGSLTGSPYEAWAALAAAMVATDCVGNGAHLSPSTSFTQLMSGFLTYPKFLCRVAAQLAGGLVGFMILDRLSTRFDLPPLSGPSFDPALVSLPEAAQDEVASAFVLTTGCILIGRSFPSPRLFLLQELLTAAVIRFCIQHFNRSGPSMHPAYATSWAVFAFSKYAGKKTAMLPHTATAHYLCYWVAPFTGALVATVPFSLFALLYGGLGMH